MHLNRNLDIYQGDDFSHTVNIFDTGGQPFVFGSQHSFSAKIKEAGATSLSPAGPTLAVFDWKKENPGKVSISLTSNNTKQIPPGRHWYEVKMITSQGAAPPIVLTLFAGLAVVHPEVTTEDSIFPDDLPALQLWLDANDSSTITLVSTNRVSVWKDKSGNDYDVTQSASAVRPTYIDYGFLDRKAIDFSGSNTLTRSPATNLGRNVEGITIYALRKYDSYPGTNARIISIAENANPRAELYIMSTGKSRAGGKNISSESSLFVESAANSSLTSYQIETGVWDIKNTNLYLYINKTLQGTNTAYHTSVKTQDVASNVLSIGSANGLSLIDGKICEILVYHSAHSDSQRAKIWAYLERKWGI
jgi:hypothetical protein